jgi:DNA ligase (NAD+)
VLHAPVRHSRPTLSLQKANTPEQVADFFTRFPGQPVVVMPKLDALSLAMVYEGGRLARAVTRPRRHDGRRRDAAGAGDGVGIPDRIDASGTTEVRGRVGLPALRAGEVGGRRRETVSRGDHQHRPVGVVFVAG